MDYQSIIEKLISGFDINSELGRKSAYNNCLEYAKKNLQAPKVFNSFVAQAAKMLDLPPVRKDVAAESTTSSGDEKLHLTFSQQTGPVLTGNRSGLSHLSRLLDNLAGSEQTGEHTHLYHDGFPMFGKTFPLTIYLENDFWFLKYANETTIGRGTPAEKRIKRNIDPDAIVAFAIFDDVPPDFPIIRGNIYKVSSCTKYQNQKIWVKGISDKSDRLFVFTFRDDNDIDKQLGLDMDDPTILFLTKNDVKKLT